MLLLLAEMDGSREGIVDELRAAFRGHYVAPEVTAKRLAQLGALATAAVLREHLPTSSTARSGDFGEVLATEVAERKLGFRVPVRRLRWKDGRDMALRGDDIVAVASRPDAPLAFLKGESKSRANVTESVVLEAAEALDRDRGHPTRHSVLFVADRLREEGQDELAENLEDAVLHSFRGHTVEHLLFVVSGNCAGKHLSKHLKANKKKQLMRRVVGVRIKDHGEFIAHLYQEL